MMSGNGSNKVYSVLCLCLLHDQAYVARAGMEYRTLDAQVGCFIHSNVVRVCVCPCVYTCDTCLPVESRW